MATYLSNRDGGKTDEQGHYRFQTNVWDGNILSGLSVAQNSPAGMSVVVAEGDIKIDYSDYAYTAWNDADSVVIISTADGSNPRIDRIVAYIDRGMTPSTANSNNPGMLKFMAVAGTPGAVPVAPNDAAVNAEVGASNPWTELARVAVGAGVSTITNGNITDYRELLTVPEDSVDQDAIQDDAISTEKYQDGSVTFEKTSGIWWEELGRFIAESSRDTLTVNIAPKKYLKIMLKTFSTGGGVDCDLRFNGDSGNNYAGVHYTGNTATGATRTSVSTFRVGYNNSTEDMVSEVFVTNQSNKEKVGIFLNANAGSSGAGNAPVRSEGIAKWTNVSTQITSVSLMNFSSGDYNTGTEIIVLGHD